MGNGRWITINYPNSIRVSPAFISGRYSEDHEESNHGELRCANKDGTTVGVGGWFTFKHDVKTTQVGVKTV